MRYSQAELSNPDHDLEVIRPALESIGVVGLVTPWSGGSERSTRTVSALLQAYAPFAMTLPANHSVQGSPATPEQVEKTVRGIDDLADGIAEAQKNSSEEEIRGLIVITGLKWRLDMLDEGGDLDINDCLTSIAQRWTGGAKRRPYDPMICAIGRGFLNDLERPTVVPRPEFQYCIAKRLAIGELAVAKRRPLVVPGASEGVASDTQTLDSKPTCSLMCSDVDYLPCHVRMAIDPRDPLKLS